MARKQKTTKAPEEKKTEEKENVIKEIKEDIAKSQPSSTPEVKTDEKQTKPKAKRQCKKSTKQTKKTKEETTEKQKEENKPDVSVENTEKTETVDKQEKQEKQEGGKPVKHKRKFIIFYNGKQIENTFVTGLRPKQAATKAITIILKRFYTTNKVLQKDIIGKEIKFFLEETVEKKGVTKTNDFYYKGSKNYIVTDQNKDDYIKKNFTLQTDKDGVIGIVAKHKTSSGEVKEVVHKYISKVYVDKEKSSKI